MIHKVLGSIDVLAGGVGPVLVLGIGDEAAAVGSIADAIPVAVLVFSWVGGESIFGVGIAVVIAVGDAMATVGVTGWAVGHVV